MGISLGANQYGKAENRVVRVYRDTGTGLSTSTCRPRCAATSPTQTRPATSPTCCRPTPRRTPPLRSPRGTASSRRNGHDHAFFRRGHGTQTTVVTVSDRGDAEHISAVSGLTDLVLLKSTGSEFKGNLKDEYTTLQEADGRIMATSVVARRHYASTDVDWNASYDTIRATLLEAFATTYSRALMGTRALQTHDAVVEIRFSAPNKHHFLVDLDPFGLSNYGEVFIAADRPYGLIEATVARGDAPYPATPGSPSRRSPEW